MPIPTEPARPDLAGRGQPEPRRILASLEHGGAPPPVSPRSRLRLAGGGAAFLIAAASAIGWLSVAGQREPALAAQPGALQAPQRPLAAAAASEAFSGGPAAAIIVETPASAQTVPAGVPGRSHGPGNAASAVPAPVRAAPAKSLPAGASLAGRARQAGAPSRDRPAAQARAGMAKPRYDSDVALLTALLAHARAQNAPAKTAASVRDEVNRDVVQARESDTTEALLIRCRQLGFIEGMLCRARICAGRPAGDAACNH